MFALPFTCSHEHYSAGAEDDHGNMTPTWADAADRACFWWPVSSTEQAAGPSGSDQARVDRVLVLDAAVEVDHRDRFIVAGRRFEVIGLPADYNHGPFGYEPDRQVVELRFVG